MTPVGRDEILSRFAGTRQCYKLFINYILRLHVKSFIPARRDPSFVLPGSRFAEAKFSHVTSARLSGMKKLINTSVWKYSWKYISIDRSKIFLLCFCDAYDINLWGKKVKKCLCRISSFYRSSHRRRSCKKGVLKHFCDIHRERPVLEYLYRPSGPQFY